MTLGHITAGTLSCPCLCSAWRCGRSFTTPPGDRDKSGQGILRLPGTCSSPNRDLSSRHCHLKKERGPRTHQLARPSGASSRKLAQIDPLRSPQPHHHLCFARAPTTETFCGLCRARLCLSGPRRHPELRGWGVFFCHKARCVGSEEVCCLPVLRGR